MSQRILVVEDDEIVREVMRRVLARRGYEVELVATAKAATGAVSRGGPFDLAVIDLHLPDGRGELLGAQLFAMGAVMPLIYTSGWPEERIPGLLTKPFTPGQLAEAVETAIGAGPN